MAQYEDLIIKGLPEWPYPIQYDKESEVTADILVIGGGAAGCAAAISAAARGAKVALVEKSATVRAGGCGAGIDHWNHSPTNPCSSITPEELTEAVSLGLNNGWYSVITNYIQCRESYDALLDLEKWGMKIRDNENEFKGAPFRDDKTKFLFSYDYKSKYSLRVWGIGMKPAQYRECRRLGVNIYDRVMVTSLLNAGGKLGNRIVGATAFNVHTGEFIVFKAKATVLCCSAPSRMWMFDTEHAGFQAVDAPATCNGDGLSMAWRAGAEFAMIEKSKPGGVGGAISHGAGGWEATWAPCTIVDSNGKEIPYVNDKLEYVPPELRGFPVNVPDQKFFIAGGTGSAMMNPNAATTVNSRYLSPRIILEKSGKEVQAIISQFVSPYYADLPSMSPYERRVIFGLMVGQEGRTQLAYRILTQSGFDPEQDMVLLPRTRGGRSGTANMRISIGANGGLLPDWDMRSNVEGLYAAGRAVLGAGGASGASATGRYAGRKAFEYMKTAGEPSVDRQQIEAERKRVYAPVRRQDGIEWKELNNGITKVMQDYCGDVKSEEMLKIGLQWFKEIRESEAAKAYARNPHELMHVMECLSMIDCGEAIMYASRARKASSYWLDFFRSDYPQIDPPEWHKWVTVKLVDGQVVDGERPHDYWGNVESLKELYAAHSGL